VKTMGAARFKEQCLAILEGLPPEGIIITKHGRPVARVTPLPQSSDDLIGVLRDKIAIHGEILSTGVAWEADAES